MQEAKIFISYSRADSEFALELAEKLRASGAEIWIDQLDISPGQRWDRAIGEALETSDLLLVILSQAAVDSDNVMDEVAYALEEKKRIVPVLHRNCKIPYRLRRVHRIDFTVGFDKGFAQLLKALNIKTGEVSQLLEQPARGEHQEESRKAADAGRQKEKLKLREKPKLRQREKPKLREKQVVVKSGATSVTDAGNFDTITEDLGGGVKLEMVSVPGGTFTMGSPDSEEGRDSDEGPQHQVTVSPFYMSKYEVTQAQWRAVATKLSKIKIALKPDPSNFKEDKLPVEQVSWEEAVEFCDRLSKATGKTYRLPTEAEWEYACRAGTTGPYAGNLDEMGWYGNNSGNKTHPVGTKQPNGFGLYDMHGNVWEWCMDWYSENYYSQSPSADPTGPSTGSDRVFRGGSWFNGLAQYCRSAIRGGGAPDDRGHDLGFRLVRTLR